MRVCKNTNQSLGITDTYARNFQEDDGKVPCGKNAQSNQQMMMVLGQLDVIGHSDEFVSRFLIGGFSSKFGCDENFDSFEYNTGLWEDFEFLGQNPKLMTRQKMPQDHLNEVGKHDTDRNKTLEGYTLGIDTREMKIRTGLH